MNMKQKKFDIKVGYVVLVEGEGLKRNKWKMGKIEEIVVGEDGVVRGASVRTSFNDKIGNIQRPLQKLYPLELGSRGNEEKETGNASEMIVDKDAKQGRNNNKSVAESCSGSLGSSGGASSGGSVKLFNEHLDKLLSNETTMRSRRTAALDGQLRRRINDLSTNNN